MSQSETEDHDVADSEPSTLESLYPTDPPKRRHKKHKKKKKKCKTMRRICFRIPKLIFLTGIGLIVVFSMKRLSETKDADPNSTASPSDVTQPVDFKDSNVDDEPVMADGVFEEDENEADDEADVFQPKEPEFAEEKNKSDERSDVKKPQSGVLKSDGNDDKEKDDEDEDMEGKHIRYRIKRTADGGIAKGREFNFKHQKESVGEIVARKEEPEDEANAFHAVLVTGVHEAIYDDVWQLIASAQKYLPYTPIVVYEINLSKRLINELANACNVEVRSFWISMFPSHLQELDNRSWRPFVIQMALAEFHFVVWMDPQTRLISSHIEPALKLATESTVTVVSSTSRQSSLSFTHQDMLTFLPTEERRLNALPHMHVTMLILHNCDDLQKNFMKWLLLCAAEKECLSPAGSSPVCDSANIARDRSDTTCHKYEESAINILLANWFEFDMRKYYISDSLTEPTSRTKKGPNIKWCIRNNRDL